MKRVDTDTYRASHIKNPRGYGLWIFRNLVTGATVEITNTYGNAKRQLPAGEWEVCP